MHGGENFPIIKQVLYGYVNTCNENIVKLLNRFGMDMPIIRKIAAFLDLGCYYIKVINNVKPRSIYIFCKGLKKGEVSLDISSIVSNVS